MNKKISIKEVSVDELIDAIKKLPSDDIRNNWIGWLSEYDEAGYYDRQPDMNRSAKFAYNHMTSEHMLLWLIQAAGVNKDLVKLAKSDSDQFINMHQKSAAIRKRVPWAMLEHTLWGNA
jgi:hypothetical protein